MPRLFLSHLLGVWLLLSQLPGEIQGQDQGIIKLCGTELVLYWIRLCGNLNWDRMALSPKQTQLRSGPFADAEALSTMEFIPASPQEQKTALSEKKPSLKELQEATLKDSNLNSEEFRKNILNQQSEAEDKIHSEFKNIGLAKHFLKKRSTLIVDKCCNFGCTKKEMARFC